MRKTLKRAAASIAAVGAVGAGALVAAPQAEAAVTPNLRLTGHVTCKFGFTPGQDWTKGIWNMTREMKVTAHGMTFKNVHLQEINGAHKFAKELKAGKSLEIKTVWPGCVPSSISGYTISDQAENLLDNVGFWWNLEQMDKGKKKDDSAGDKSGGGDGTTETQARALLKHIQ